MVWYGMNGRSNAEAAREGEEEPGIWEVGEWEEKGERGLRGEEEKEKERIRRIVMCV